MSEFSCSIKSGKNFKRCPRVVENMEGEGGLDFEF